MVAPTPVSGLLHAVAVVKSGAFGLGRVAMYTFGPEAVGDLGVGLPLAVAAGATAVLAGVVALRKDKIKRALAYSTVSQLSYIALGFAIDARLAVFGALLHVLAHAFMKVTLFFVAGVIYVETGVEYLDGVAGIARRLPATMTAFAVAAAGLAGFPLVAGFVSKLHLVLGTFTAGVGAFAAVYFLAGTLKLLLFWPIISAAFVGSGPPLAGQSAVDADGGRASAAADGGHGSPGAGASEWERRSPLTETSPALLGPVLFAAGAAVALGVVPGAFPPVELAELTVTEVFDP
jgi:NADH-quinone oxidoreductase subunit L/multicomponent Na+:H+ antiporter subunit D